VTVLVGIEGFGSIWIRRAREERRHDVYLNTTGLFHAGRLCYRTQVRGMVRFHCLGGFNPYSLSRNCGRVFESENGLASGNGGQRLVLGRLIHQPVKVDAFLFVTSSKEVGVIHHEDASSRSSSVRLIALSQQGNQQEALWLMPPFSWIRSDRTLLVTKTYGRHSLRATLEPVPGES
jgi:hypothetical protein